MAFLGFELLIRLLWGCALSLVFIKRVETSERFVKIAAHIIFGIAVFAALLLSGSSKEVVVKSLTSLFSLVLGVYLYAYFVPRAARILGFCLLLAGPIYFVWDRDWLSFYNFLSSSLILGGFFGGQYLGHWFLNVPGMHIRELKRITTFLWLGLFSKILEIFWTLLSHRNSSGPQVLDAFGRPTGIDIGNTTSLLALNPSESLFSLEGSLWLGLGTYGWILLSMRLMWGIFAPLVLAWMIQKTVNARSTQSATGILYAACVMVLVGEATALYLKQALGWNV